MIDVCNLYEPSLIDSVRLFCRLENIDEEDTYGLYLYETVATAGLNLLHKNNIKEVWTAGIDGGYDYYKYFSNPGRAGYNHSVKVFRKLCKKWRIRWHRLK
jgi:hypothetical protein